IAFPLFFQGGLSLLSDALDLGVALAMTALLGWHWAFLPTMVTELVPILDLFPTWTVAVFYVTRGGGRDPEPQPSPGPRLKDITPERGTGEGGAAREPSRVPNARDSE